MGASGESERRSSSVARRRRFFGGEACVGELQGLLLLDIAVHDAGWFEANTQQLMKLTQRNLRTAGNSLT